MARKRPITETHSRGLEPAWPAAPSRNPRFVLYCVNHENGKQYVVNSYACYAAKKIVDYILDGDEYEFSPLTHGTIGVREIDIRSDQMQEILDHKYTPEEEAWQLPTPYPENIMRFMTGKKKLDDTPSAPVKPAAPRQKIDRTGKTSIQELCDELKVEPRDARAALRKAKIEKPAGGWIFDADQLDKIRAIIKKAKK